MGKSSKVFVSKYSVKRTFSFKMGRKIIMGGTKHNLIYKLQQLLISRATIASRTDAHIWSPDPLDLSVLFGITNSFIQLC